MSSLDGRDLEIDDFCFACGQANPHGLKMRVEYEGQEAVCRLSLAGHYQGWANIAHGGVISTVLDEIMAYAVLHFVGSGVTMRMETAFRSPVPLGPELEVRGRIKEVKGRRAQAEAELRLAGQEKILANATAHWLIQLGKDGKSTPARL